MRFVAVPISSRSVFIHCMRHNHPTTISSSSSNRHLLSIPDSALENNDELSKKVQTHNSITIPSSTTQRLDDKLVAKASKLWSSFEHSKTPWKQKLVKGINVLLEQIPYSESSLRSIPAKHSVLRKQAHLDLAQSSSSSVETEKIQDKSLSDSQSQSKDNEKLRTHLSYSDFEKLSGQSSATSSGSSSSATASTLPAHHILEPISVYYPNSIISAEQTYAAMRALALDGRSIHLKNMLFCLLFVPLTLPVALLPVIPNIPGFYLMYRAWCNFRALEGARHLSYLTEESVVVSSSSTSQGNPSASIAYKDINTLSDRPDNHSDSNLLVKGHLIFRPCPQLDAIFSKDVDSISNGRAVYKYEGSTDPAAVIKAHEDFEAAVKNSKSKKQHGFTDKMILKEDMITEIEKLVEYEETSDLNIQLLKALHQTQSKIKKVTKE